MFAVPDFTVPDFTVPQLGAPELTVPEVTVPGLTAPGVTVPGLTGAPRRSLPPVTVARAVAADPGRWRHLLRYEPDAPSRVDLPVEHHDLVLWLCGWLPGQSARLSPPEGLFVVVSGLITELGSAGERTVRAGQTRVYGPGPGYRLANLAHQPAITVHARPAR